VIVRVRIALTALLVALVAFVASPASALAAKAPKGPLIYARAAILVSSDGAVLYAKRPDQMRRVASTTKMLTALVVREHLDLDEQVTITRKAANVDGGAIGLRVGETMSVRELLAVMLVHSANGAAEALAIGVAGSEKKFVKMMEAKAVSLGLKHTHPKDPHGLTKVGVSSAYDLSVIARELMKDEVLREMVLQRSAHTPHGSYATTDKLLGRYRGIEGIKTGYTDPAGYCFAAAAKRDDVELFAIVLGADTTEQRFAESRRLLDWGFANAAYQEVVSRAETMGAIEIEGGENPSVTVHPEGPLSMVALKGSPNLTHEVSLPATLSAPVAAGQRLGTLRLTFHGSVIASVPLVADSSVGKTTLKLAAPTEPGAVAPQHQAKRPGFWSDVAHVWAGLGRLLGI
jgi:D-alanyl-D-alanine carboxypeptidase (penicillin-binding protein 5/6)